MIKLGTCQLLAYVCALTCSTDYAKIGKQVVLDMRILTGH